MSRCRARSVVVVAALVVGCSSPPAPAREVLDEAVGAIGGRPAIEAVRTLVMEGSGEIFGLGQNRTPDGELPKLQVDQVTRAIDFANLRWRQEQVVTPMYRSTRPGPRKEIAGLDGEVAFNIAADGTATRASPPDARERQAQLGHSLLGMLRAALRPDALVSNRRQAEGRDIVDVRTADGATFTLAIDAATRLPVEVTSMTDLPNLGDVVWKTEFGDYQAAGDLRLPTRITSRADRYTMATLRVSRNRVNEPVGDLAAPAAARSAAAEPAHQVAVDEVASGVWLLSGGSHHSAVVEFADHLTLIEAPLDEPRTLAVIARARQLRPSKPLTHVVVTHHHVDHSGGLRAAVSEGITIIAHEKSRRFIEEMMTRPHTIAPDALARRPRPLQLEAAGARTLLTDATRTMELHAADSGHADTMLVAYLPRERLLIEVDLYTPMPATASAVPVFPYASVLLDLVRSQNMNVDRVVPLHRGIATFADLVDAAEKTAPPAAL